MFKEMSLAEISIFVCDHPDEAKERAEEITDRLRSLCWQIGVIWDKVKAIDPNKGVTPRYGTPNKRSHTYKMRKVAGYTYP